jgi:hypothetical protein
VDGIFSTCILSSHTSSHTHSLSHAWSPSCALPCWSMSALEESVLIAEANGFIHHSALCSHYTGHSYTGLLFRNNLLGQFAACQDYLDNTRHSTTASNQECAGKLQGRHSLQPKLARAFNRSSDLFFLPLGLKLNNFTINPVGSIRFKHLSPS